MKFALRILTAVILMSSALFASAAHAACTNPAGVEGEMAFNESENLYQYCDNTNWIAMVGGNPATGGSDYVPNAVTYDGSNDYLTRGADLTGVVDSKKVTISFWHRPNANGDDQIFDTVSNKAVLSISNTELRFGFRNSTPSGIVSYRSSTGVVPTGEWSHFLISFDLDGADTNNRHAYVNGVDVSGWNTYVDDLVDFTAGNFLVGDNAAFRVNGDYADFWFETDVYIDFSIEANRRKFIDAAGNPVYLGANGELPTGTAPDIFLSGDTATWHTNKGTGGGFTENGALTTAATTPYTPITKIVPSGLIGHWRLDETSGTTAFDSSGNGNDGTLTGNFTSDSAKGVIQRGHRHPTSFGATIAVPDTPDLSPTDAITLAAWIYSEEVASSSHQRIITKWGAGGNQYQLFVANQNYGSDGQNNQIALELKTTGGANLVLMDADSNIFTGGNKKWHHVAATYNRSQAVIYIDGVAVKTASASAPINTGSEDLKLGHGGGGTQFLGIKDDVRLYNRALTADEVAELYAARDGIRYNESMRTPEFFDGNQFVAMPAPFPEPGKALIYGDFPDLGCPSVGDLCSDGSIFVGDTNLYITDADQSTGIQWNATLGNNDIDPDSNSDGEANYANLTVPLNTLPAMELCGNLDRHGHTDWFLPSRFVLDGIEVIKEIIDVNASEDFDDTQAYWSSSEFSNNNDVWRISFSTGAQSGGDKDNSHDVRCVRRSDRPIIGNAGLVGHWKLDETEGTTAVDSSGNGNNGTLTNMNATNDSTKGVVGKSLNFNGTNDYIDAGTDVSFQLNGDMTLSTWINVNTPTSQANEGIILFGGIGETEATNYLYSILLDTSAGKKDLFWFHENDGGVNNAIIFTNAIEFGRWHHITMLRDVSTNEISFYKDGVFISSQAYANDSTGGTGGGLFIGNNVLFGSGIQMNGQIDDVRIYNRALSADEITQLYNMGAPVGSSTALPQGCPNIGDTCDDGTIYAGLSPDGNIPMFAETDEIPTALPWNNGNASNTVATGATDPDSGEDNTNLIVTIDSDSATADFQPHQLIQYCYDYQARGADDWYVPSRNEWGVMWDNLVDEDGDNDPETPTPGYDYNFSNGRFFTSTETGTSVAAAIDVDDGSNPGNLKNVSRKTRCVRKGPAPRCANPYGLEGQIIYNSTHNVAQYCDGARWLSIGKDG